MPTERKLDTVQEQGCSLSEVHVALEGDRAGVSSNALLFFSGSQLLSTYCVSSTMLDAQEEFLPSKKVTVLCGGNCICFLELPQQRTTNCMADTTEMYFFIVLMCHRGCFFLGTIRKRSLLGLILWFADGHPLPVSSSHSPPDCVCVQIFSQEEKTLVILHQGPS